MNAHRRLCPQTQKGEIFCEGGDVTVVNSILHLTCWTLYFVSRGARGVEDGGETSCRHPPATGIVDVEDHCLVFILLWLHVQETL